MNPTSTSLAGEVFIVDGPLRDQGGPERMPSSSGAGAVLTFLGVVRADEHGRRISALDYQTYEPMAQKQMRDLIAALITKHGVTRISVWHSRGRVPVGATSFRLMIEAPHRKEALAAMDEFIDRLKSDVPIWKSPVWADEPRC